MPAGIWFAQNAIGSPNTRVSKPAFRRYAADESPYGPAPTTVTLQPDDLLFKTLPLIDSCPSTASPAQLHRRKISAHYHFRGLMAADNNLSFCASTGLASPNTSVESVSTRSR